MIELATILIEAGEPLQNIFDGSIQQPPLEYLLSGIMRRLGEDECSLLLDLTVFRNPAPVDVWYNDQTGVALNGLRQRGLLHNSDRRRGEIEIVAAFRDVLYPLLSPEQRRELHVKAANIRVERYEYTAAIYHYRMADLPVNALNLWDVYREQEINQGQAQAALSLLRSLPDTRLETNQQERLSLWIAELELLCGNLPQALNDIHATLRNTPILQVIASDLQGRIHNDLTQPELAKKIFRDGLRKAENLIEARKSLLHKGMGWNYKKERELDLAWKEGILARYEAENFLGYIQEEWRNYDEAEKHYRIALEMAEEINYIEGLAKTGSNLACLYMLLGKFETCADYFEEARKQYRKVGTERMLAILYLNQGIMHNLAGNNEDALQVLQQSEGCFNKISGSISIYETLIIAQARAEAYLGLDRLDEAEAEIRPVVQSEESFILVDAYRTFGEIMLAKGDLKTSKEFIVMSKDFAEDDLYMQGYAYRALGKVKSAQGDKQSAKVAFDQAIRCFESINLTWEAQRTG